MCVHVCVCHMCPLCGEENVKLTEQTDPNFNLWSRRSNQPLPPEFSGAVGSWLDPVLCRAEVHSADNVLMWSVQSTERPFYTK